jgi:hypothetical protein
MKHFLFILICLLSFHSFAAKPSIPPLDSAGKDYCYYFDYVFDSPKSWDSTLFFTQKFMDSFYVNKYEMIGIDTVQKVLKIRITNKLKSRGMLRNTHKPVYADCSMTFDYLIYYTPTGLHCKIKRLVHYYTYTEESSYMGKTTGQKSMRTNSERIEIPMIQTDIKMYTKKMLEEANEDILNSISTFTNYKWKSIPQKNQKPKTLEDDDY